jgi:hypothetical protein
MITAKTTALLAALSLMTVAAPAAFAINSADQGDITFQENKAKIKQHQESEATNISISGTGHSGGNTVLSGNVATATVTQTNDNPHANVLTQVSVCDIAILAAVLGC